ncbi:MAG TPA: DUF2726 domain-containing protein [Nitrospira sp.]|jgi:hypothetical protein
MNAGFFDSWIVGLMVAVPALLLWRTVFHRSRRTLGSAPFVVPVGAILRPQPFLGERQLLLYNLIRLAAEDRYLVFAQVPLWSFLAVEAQGESRVELLRHLALKRADVILVHPGSRVVEQVVQFEAPEPTSDPSDASPGREVQRLVQAAGIRVTTLDVQPSYTVQELERLLGMSDHE